MELVFVDESGDTKFKEYFGLCVAVLNAAHYKAIKGGFQAILRKSEWDESIEFKGSHLFSASKGDTKVSIERRIEIAQQVLGLNKSTNNARMRFHYARRHDCEDSKAEYLECLPILLNRALPKPKKGRGKDLVAVSCDYRSDIKAQEIQKSILPVLEDKGYALLEEVTTPQSNFHTVGLLYADIVSYLSARIDTISNDVELFENIPPAQLKNSGKVRKLKSSRSLIQRVKSLDRYIVE